MTDFDHLTQEKSDIERLTKELDNEISGSQNSAEKPALCDLIGTVDRQRINAPHINRMLNKLYREANSGDLRTSASKAKDIPFVSNAICQYIGLVNATVEGIRQELTNKSLTDMEYRRNLAVIHTARKALRFLAENPRPANGQTLYNTEHLFDIAKKLEQML